MSRRRSSSLLSSPLDPLDEEQRNAAKALWASKYTQWEKDRLNRDEQEAEKEVEKMTLGQVKGKGAEEEKGLYDSDDPDPYDRFHAPSPDRQSGLLQLAKPAKKEKDTEDDIVDSYAQTESTSNDTILYSIRTKLAKALVLREKIHGAEHEICIELKTFSTQASLGEQEVTDADYAGKATTASLDRILWRAWSSAWISEAIGAWELIDTERSGGLDALRNKILMVDLEEAKAEKEKNQAGGGE